MIAPNNAQSRLLSICRSIDDAGVAYKGTNCLKNFTRNDTPEDCSSLPGQKCFAYSAKCGAVKGTGEADSSDGTLTPMPKDDPTCKSIAPQRDYEGAFPRTVLPRSVMNKGVDFCRTISDSDGKHKGANCLTNFSRGEKSSACGEAFPGQQCYTFTGTCGSTATENSNNEPPTPPMPAADGDCFSIEPERGFKRMYISNFSPNTIKQRELTACRSLDDSSGNYKSTNCIRNFSRPANPVSCGELYPGRQCLEYSGICGTNQKPAGEDPSTQQCETILPQKGEIKNYPAHWTTANVMSSYIRSCREIPYEDERFLYTNCLSQFEVIKENFACSEYSGSGCTRYKGICGYKKRSSGLGNAR